MSETKPAGDSVEGSTPAIPLSSSSPAKKSSSAASHKTHHHRGKGQLRRLSQGMSSVSALRDTLQAFGDDVIKIKDPTHLSLSIPSQMDQSSLGSVNPSFVVGSSELIDNVFSGERKGESVQFERIPSDEVGVRSTRWKRALLAGLLSSRLSQKKTEEKAEGDGDELEFHEIPEVDRKPPFWGVGVEMRSKFSLLNLQLILHEIGCFSSCILLGCLIVRALEVVTSVNTNARGSDMNASWNFSRLYGSFQSFLLVFTSLGVLIRVNTLKTSSLLTMPLFVTSVLLLVSTEYLNKAWDLQRHECQRYFKLDEAGQAKAHLTHDCNVWKDGNQNSSSPITIFTSVFPAIVAFFMCLYLFLFRNSYYLINQFANAQQAAAPAVESQM